MKQSKDPFEAAFAEEEEEEEEDLEEDSPPESPSAAPPLPSQTQTQTSPPPPPPPPPPPYLDATSIAQEDDQIIAPSDPSSSMPMLPSSRTKPKSKDVAAAADDYEDNDDNNMDVELTKFPSSADPDKMAKMQSILSQFTEDQMTRYESFRRSALQKSNMRRLLVSITGTQKISLPMTIVVCGIAKMFVGELVETARIVMKERKESGPIRPCHIREAYRRLKLEGKVAKRSVPRLFR